MKRRIAPHLDWFTTITMVFLVGIGIYSWFQPRFLGLPQMGSSTAVAIISGLTVGLAVHRLRRPKEVEQPSVKQTFNWSDHTNIADFGLKNYGNGTAHYIQIEVTNANSGKELFSLKPREPPVHLEEDEFFGFMYDRRSEDDRLLAEIREKKEIDGMVHIYYSFVSSMGSRAPPEAYSERPDEYVLDNVVEVAKMEPRRMELKRIQSLCRD